MKTHGLLTTLLEFAAAYAIVGLIYYYNDAEFQMRTLDIASRACWEIARMFGQCGIRAEREYHRIAEIERMN